MCDFIGEMAERSNAAVLKTVDCNRSGGSNPSFSAESVFQKKHKNSKPFKHQRLEGFLFFGKGQKTHRKA